MRAVRLALPLLLVLTLAACSESETVSTAPPSASSPAASPDDASAQEIQELLRVGWDQDAKLDLRRLATDEEVLLTDTNSYGSIEEIEASGREVRVSPGVTLKVVGFQGSEGYCLSARHERSENTWFYDGAAGGLQPAGAPGCPQTTEGTPGGEKSVPYTPEDLAADEEAAREIAEGDGDAEPGAGEEDLGALEQSLANVATIMEESLVGDRYLSFAQMREQGLTEFGIQPGVRVTIVSLDAANSYCLKAERDGEVRFFDAAAGGLQPEGATSCPEATKGAPGGTEQG